MSFPSRHGSVRIHIGRISPNTARRNRSKIIYVDLSKSPSELVFFRESFSVIDAYNGTNWKRIYTGLIDGYQCGNIEWTEIPGFFITNNRRQRGYIAAISRVCEILEEIFKTLPRNKPTLEAAVTVISKLADYAQKVYLFRSSRALNHGHIVASDAWEFAASRLRRLQTFLKAQIPPEVKPLIVIMHKPTPVPEPESPYASKASQFVPPICKDINENSDTIVKIDEDIGTKPVPPKSNFNVARCSNLKLVVAILLILFLIGIVGTVVYFVA